MSYEGSEYTETEQQPQMEEVNDSTPQDSTADVCRDFLKGRCTRSNCKYKHDTAARDSKLIDSPVCKDYQNAKCFRERCKFLHLTPDEEEEFKKTGVMPEKKTAEQGSNSGPEICRDFKNGHCNRGQACKYAHQAENMHGGFNLAKRPSSVISDFLPSKRLAQDYFSMGNNTALEQENEALKREVTELRKQVLELQQQNDTLLGKQSSNNNVSTNGQQGVNKSSGLLPNPYSQNHHYSY